MNLTQENIVPQIMLALENDSIVLPTMPDMALNIQRMIEDPNISADKIVIALSCDPFVVAQLIKSANCALYAGKARVGQVKEAVYRLGYRQMRNLVISLTMNKMFKSENSLIQRHLKGVWDHSRKVASVSYVIAREHNHLSADQAMLSGLMHDIGVLPLCLYLDQHRMQVSDVMLESMICQCSAQIGALLLRKWQFAEEIVSAVAEHETLQRESVHFLLVDYADIVTIANLLEANQFNPVAWVNIDAIHRAGWTEDQCNLYLKDNGEEIAHVAVMLGMNVKATNLVSHWKH